MHLQAYLRSAAEIVRVYDGRIPFAAWLKTYFSQHKKFGSKDRKRVADLCFCYFRLGKAFDHLGTDERLLAAQTLCRADSVFVAGLKPEWQHLSGLPLPDKLAGLLPEGLNAIFPLPEDVSEVIDKNAFGTSHLVQPDLFLRLRPGQKETVLQKLEAASVSFSVEGDCVRLPNGSKIDTVLSLDREAVVQDKNSQRVPDLLPQTLENAAFSCWDCCAASGGKSILLHDRFPRVSMAVSDVRESILHNLKSRFRRAGINRYGSFVADVSSPGFGLQKKFDLVLCDAPCSGSGTWGRTPEQLRFFDEKKIDHYASLQKAIALNAARCLKKGGLFLYVTCSVFAKENEGVVAFIAAQTGLALKEQRYFTGYGEKADTLYAALFAADEGPIS